MKEMNWTREEALKRLTIVFKCAEEDMEQLAVNGIKAPTKKIREDMLADAVEKHNFIIGIIGAACALGISLEEMSALEVDEEEMSSFMEELANDKREELNEKQKHKISDLLEEMFG